MVFQGSNLLSILVFIAFGAGVGTFFYFRILARKESNKVYEQLENLAKKLNLLFRIKETETVGNEVFPELSGTFQGRGLLIERTLKNKYKYFVVSLSFKNASKMLIQIIPKSHLDAKQPIDASKTVATGNAAFDEAYLLVSPNAEKSAQFVEKHFLGFLKKYEQILFLFSTFIIFQEKMTLVLASTDRKLKNDLILEEISKTLSDWATDYE